jgi:hypothetical protein
MRIATLIVATALASSAMAQDASPTTYYFVEDKICTVLVDFQKQRDDIERLSGDQRLLRLIRSLVGEFAVNGATKCKGSDSIRMMAVYIPGVDSYDRPDFPNRVNIVRIDGSSTEFNAASQQDFTDIKKVQLVLAITTFDQRP